MSHKDPDVDLASVSSKVILSDLLLKENATVSKTMNIQLITKHYCRLAETIHTYLFWLFCLQYQNFVLVQEKNWFVCLFVTEKKSF